MSHYENINITLKSQGSNSVQILKSSKLRPIPRQIINLYDLQATSTQSIVEFDYPTFGKMLNYVDLAQVAMSGFDINYFVDYEINILSSYNFKIRKSQNKDFALLKVTEFFNTDWSYLRYALSEETNRIDNVMKSGNLESSYLDALFDRVNLLTRCATALKNMRDNPNSTLIEPELTDFFITLL